jgi:methanogenic corrinoid protein MtbC1
VAKRALELGGYSIASVSKLTGISCHALRIWERRYGFPMPCRSPSGHRRYGAQQVETLRRIAPLVRSGRRIGELLSDIVPGALPMETLACEGGRQSGELGAMVDHLSRCELHDADELYDRLTRGLSVLEQIERVIEPGMIEIGERWFRGACEIFQERCASGFFRRKLALLLERARSVNTRPHARALVGAVQGDLHEGGILILGLLLELSEWRAINLGTDLPTEEFQKGIEAYRPAAVCVSMAMSRSLTKRFQELASLRGAPVFVGGRSIVNYCTLARRHGLIPMSGSAVQATPELIRKATELARRREAASEHARDGETHGDSAPADLHSVIKT